MLTISAEDPYASMENVKTQTNLLKSIDNLTSQVADLTTQNKTLQQKVNNLLSQISVGNNVRKVNSCF